MVKNKNSNKNIMNFPAVNHDVCTGCGNCINICPLEAMSFVDCRVMIDADQCNHCLLCAMVCPVEAIS